MVETFAADHKIPREAIHQASIERRERLDNAASPTTVEPTDAVVEPTDAIVEPTETVSAAEDTFELDDTLAHGLRAAGDVRPLHKLNPHAAGPQQQQHIDPTRQYEAEYGGGCEEDGRAV